jgi:predicted RNA-binding Zn-ribbon protein involved in translation (DUF1610 family)
MNNLEKELKCTNCGSNNFMEGRLGGGADAFVVPNKSFAFNGGKRSKLIVHFCLDCGEVHTIRVEKPEAFN